jgi:hypothetical protein
MKNAVFWDVAPCTSCVNRRFGGTYRLRLQGRKSASEITSVCRWQQTEPTWLRPPAHAGFSLADFSILKMEALRSSETSIHTRSTRRHIPENGILHESKALLLRQPVQFVNLNMEAVDNYLPAHTASYHRGRFRTVLCDSVIQWFCLVGDTTGVVTYLNHSPTRLSVRRLSLLSLPFPIRHEINIHPEFLETLPRWTSGISATAVRGTSHAIISTS